MILEHSRQALFAATWALVSIEVLKLKIGFLSLPVALLSVASLLFLLLFWFRDLLFYLRHNAKERSKCSSEMRFSGQDFGVAACDALTRRPAAAAAAGGPASYGQVISGQLPGAGSTKPEEVSRGEVGDLLANGCPLLS